MPSTPFGQHLRQWRQLRHLSQLQLSAISGVAQRHLSFIETGRSRPGRDVVLRLAAALDMPLLDRNALLTAAGLPAEYDASPATAEHLAPLLAILEQMIANHSPLPAIILNADWLVVGANPPAQRLFLGGRDPSGRPIDAVSGLFDHAASRAFIDNWNEVAWAALWRLRREAQRRPHSARIQGLLALAEGAVAAHGGRAPINARRPTICARMRVGDEVIETTVVVAHFDTVAAVALEGMRVELVYPANDAARRFFAH